MRPDQGAEPRRVDERDLGEVDDDQLGQGRENAKRFLRENPEVAMQLQAKVYELVGLGEKTDGEDVPEEIGAGGEEGGGIND